MELKHIPNDGMSPLFREQALKIWNQVYPVSIAHEDLTSFEKNMEEIGEREDLTMIENNNLVGWLFLFTRFDQPWFGIVVHPDHQGKGIGQALMARAMDLRDELHGWVIPHNDYKRMDGQPYPSPIGFYEKLGFEIRYDQTYENEKIKAIRIRWSKKPDLQNMELSEEQIRNIAAQLRRPHGEEGIEMGHRMAESNATMITDAIHALEVKKGDHILELGHGNGHHLGQLFSKAQGLKYVGLDISETMHAEAVKWVSSKGLDDQARFVLYDGSNLPLEDETFDKAFSVNTIYFWEDPNLMLSELARVLRPDGRLVLSLGLKSYMMKLIFTRHGFTKYSPGDFEKLIQDSPFAIEEYTIHEEEITSKEGTTVQRTYMTASLVKK
jgi:SAM-dependent methyltransferase